MKKLNENRLFLYVILAVLVVAFFYFLLLRINESAGSVSIVTKVIDGDTVVVEGGYHVRLLGIDTDERGYPCYNEAKKRLEELVLNKEVYLESDKDDKDQYERYLRYLILDEDAYSKERLCGC